MALEHANLIGDQLHEPKGADAAASGTVYTSNGSGSGTWVDPTSTIYNKNITALTLSMTDLAAASSVYFYVPYKCKIRSYHFVVYGAVDANTTITPYINGVAVADTMTITAAGSAAGQATSVVIASGSTMASGSIVRFDSNGAATASLRADVTLVLEVVP